MDRLKEALWDPMRAMFLQSGRFYWLYAITALVFALAVFVQQTAPEARSVRGFFGYVFPRSTYGHQSAITDFLFFVVNRLLYWLLVGPFLLEMAQASVATSKLLSHLTPAVTSTTSTWWKNILFTLLTAAAVDFGLFWGHWLMHRVPLFWEFHKVHHSAEVMTPISSFRQHPVDDIVNFSVSAACGGVMQGTLVHFMGGGPREITVLGLNVLIFVFYIFAYNLRHSHVWICYSPTLSKFLVSPAAHQIHHSRDPKHFDKNLGIMFAVWDWGFGSLYVPGENEKVEFGLGGEEHGEYRSIRRLYLRPFTSAYRNRERMFQMSPRARLGLLVTLGVVSSVLFFGLAGSLLAMRS